MNARAAAEEGWELCLDRNTGKHFIKRIIGATQFSGTAEALAFVRAGAKSGNLLHVIALAVCGQTTLESRATPEVRVLDKPPKLPLRPR
jgi:hypothetical protein